MTNFASAPPLIPPQPPDEKATLTEVKEWASTITNFISKLGLQLDELSDAYVANTAQMKDDIVTSSKLAGAVRTDIANGVIGFTGTVNYRTTGAPSATIVPTLFTSVTETDGSVSYTLEWTYTQGASKADFFPVFWRTTAGPLAVTDAHYEMSARVDAGVLTYQFTLRGVPSNRSLTFGVAAARRTESGLEIGAITSSLAAPDWDLVNQGTPSFTGNIAPFTAISENFDFDNNLFYTSTGDTAAVWTWATGNSRLEGSATGAQSLLIRGNFFAQDVDFFTTMDQAGDSGVVARVQDSNNYYLLAIRDNTHQAADGLQVYKRVAGTFTSLGSATITWVRGDSHKIHFTLVASRLQVYFDNILQISIIDTTYAGSGRIGFRVNDGAIGRFLDASVFSLITGVIGDQPGAGSNLIVNPSFEDSGYAWRAQNVTGSTVFTVTTGAAQYADSKAVATENVAGADTGISTFGEKDAAENASIAASALTRYQFATWVNIISGSGTARLRVVEWNSTGGVVLDNDNLATTTATGWRRLAAVVTSAATTAFFSVRLNYNATGVVNWDGAQCVQGAVLPAFDQPFAGARPGQQVIFGSALTTAKVALGANLNIATDNAYKEVLTLKIPSSHAITALFALVHMQFGAFADVTSTAGSVTINWRLLRNGTAVRTSADNVSTLDSQVDASIFYIDDGLTPFSVVNEYRLQVKANVTSGAWTITVQTPANIVAQMFGG